MSFVRLLTKKQTEVIRLQMFKMDLPIYCTFHTPMKAGEISQCFMKKGNTSSHPITPKATLATTG
jgi:hypothetical protein